MKASPDDSPGWNGTNQSGFTGCRAAQLQWKYALGLRILVEFLADGSNAWYRNLYYAAENVSAAPIDDTDSLFVAFGMPSERSERVLTS